MAKPIVLILLACYLPGYKSGGPVQSIANMVDRLGDQLDFHIITADRDLSDIKSYSNVVIDGWNMVGKAKVFYVSPKNISLFNLARLIRKTPHDVLYLNSFFEPYFTVRPLLARYFGMIPKRHTIIAPRGEFSVGALALKWWKKWPFISFIKVFEIYRDLVWHASSKYEADDIQRTLGIAPNHIVIAIVIASDLASFNINYDTAVEQQKCRALGNPLRLCFLSRITPMKNVDFALQVLAEVKVPVQFNIYGVIEDKIYWQYCQKLIQKLPPNIDVQYHGAIDHANVLQVLTTQDLFFFPTRGENYGHVIQEAMSSGLPVLISDQTPWRNLGALGVGWDLPLNSIKEFCAVIETQASLNCSAQKAQRLRVIQYAERIATDKGVISDNLNLFLSPP